MQQSNITWDNVESLIDKIAKEIESSGKKYQWIISINRGGVIPGVLLSHRLGITHGVLTVTHYDGKKMLDEVVRDLYISGVRSIKSHHNILLVDDMADSGICLKESQLVLKKLDSDAKNIDTATLYCKKKSIVHPTFFGEQIDDNLWINFPWEYRK